VSGLTGGSYTVTITEVATGCTTEASFTVQTTVDTKEAQYFKNINVSPNPASGLTTLSVELTNAANVTVELRDVLGRMIWSNPTVSTQSLQLPIDVSQQAPGVYNISLIVDNQVFVRKLVVVR
jgi:hypothetical protein